MILATSLATQTLTRIPAPTSNIATSSPTIATIEGDFTIPLFYDFESLHFQGRVTTLFTPAPSCVGTVTRFDNEFSPSYVVGASLDFNTQCLPAQMVANTVNALMYNYSPAYCPSGWTSAATTTAITDFPTGAWTILPDTSQAYCCPTGFTYLPETMGGYCQSWATPSEPISLFILQEDGGTQLLTTSYSTSLEATAYYINVLWQSTDSEILALIASSPTSSIATSMTSSLPFTSTQLQGGQSFSSSSSTTISPETINTPPKEPSSSTSTLSAGTKAGIAIAVVLLAAIAMFGIFWWLQRRRRNNPRLKLEDTPPDVPKSEFSTYPIPSDRRRSDLSKYPIPIDKHELDTVANRYELSAVSEDRSARHSFFPTKLLRFSQKSQPRVYVELEATTPVARGAADPRHELAGSEASATTVSPTESPSSTTTRSSSTTTQGLTAAPPSHSRRSRSDATDDTGASRLELLQERLERVRSQRERLAKVRHLDDVEADLQREIMLEQKNAHSMM